MFTLTSPILPHLVSSKRPYSILVSLNSAKISSNGFLKTSPKVFNLPLCAIPKMQWLTLSFPAFQTKDFRAGICTSQPSTPNLFEVLNLVFRKRLNVSFSHKSLRIFSFLSLEISKKAGDSIWSSNQFLAYWHSM